MHNLEIQADSGEECVFTIINIPEINVWVFSFFFRLALYVYEYLLHIGATKAAQTFLSEIRWEKNITLGEPPGFLHSWWW